MPQIWVDADACPVRIRDLIARAAHRRGIQATFVANMPVQLMQSDFLSSIQVSAEPDAADAYIEKNAQAGDLVITQDIPLAALLVPKDISVIAPRGIMFTPENIADLLSRRDLMSELRDIGKVTTRTPPLDETAVRKFANMFDAAVQKLVICLLLLQLVNPIAAYAESQALIEQALKAYQDGKYENCARLLAQDLKDNPNDGIVHFYMGTTLKKLGYDVSAVNELEKAFTMVPPQLIATMAQAESSMLPKLPRMETPKTLARDAAAKVKKENAAAESAAKTAPPQATAPAAHPPGDWLSNLKDGFNRFAASANQAAKLPEMVAQLKDLIKRAKAYAKAKNFKGFDVGKKKKKEEAPAPATTVATAPARRNPEIIPMSEMMSIVERSKGLDKPDWASSSEGITQFQEAPEGFGAWELWRQRYKKAFQFLLLRHLAKEALDHQRGAVACAFSVDKHGNLRGKIYASTGDDTLNNCLLETIRELDHSRILAFPPYSKISGYNFRMKWDFGRLLTYIKAYEAEKEKTETAAVTTSTDATITSGLARLAEKRAKAEKLAAAELAKKSEEEAVKTSVFGKIIPKPKPQELKAVALKLTEMHFDAKPAKPNEDTFRHIDDSTIMSWPDLNPQR